MRVRIASILSEKGNMKTKTVKIVLDSFGSYLGRGKGCLTVRNKEGKVKRYPLFENEISEIRVKSGNIISAGALATCGFWNIDCLILSRHGNPIATVRSLTDDSHVETRICQYEALRNDKCLEIAKAIVLAKIKGQNELLKKYGLRSLDVCYYSQAIKKLNSDNRRVARNRLMSYEGKCSDQYFKQILPLFEESIRPENRRTYKAYDGINNVLNLAYNVLFWKVQIAVTRAKLEPYLGFLHVIQFGLPSLVCDLEEIYRYLVDSFVIDYCRNVGLSDKDFVMETENYSSPRKKGMREYLSENKTRDITNRLNKYFETKVEIPRIKRGAKQELETLIREEAFLFAMYLRDEKPTWHPRIVVLS